MDKKRGFALLPKECLRELAKRGGQAVHKKGTGHQWTSEEARDAGRKGGLISAARCREARLAEETGEIPAVAQYAGALAQSIL